jgi:hypothetical protein
MLIVWVNLPDCGSNPSEENSRQKTASQEESEPMTEQEKEEGAEFVAYMGCRRATKQRLKSPSSADFPLGPDRSSCDEDNHCVVEGEFSAKHPMGTRLRKELVCEIKLDPENPGSEKMELQRFEFK